MAKPDEDDTAVVPGGSSSAGTSADPHPTAEMPEVDGSRGNVRPGRDGGGRDDGGRDGGGRDDGGPDGSGPVSAPPARGNPGRGLIYLVGVVALVFVVALGSRAIGLWPHLSNPFASRTTDRSQPVLLKSIQDLHRFVGASGNFQVVIDVQKDRKYIPSIIFNDRTLFVAAGTVDAFVDFGGLDGNAIAVDQQTKTVTVKLPAPELEKANIDHKRSYVFAEQQGIVNKVGDLFGGDVNKQQQLYVLAEQRIGDAAKDSGLGDRAQQNTQKMLEQMIKALGYTTVNVSFAQP